MSGPKGASYVVVSEAELRRRAVAAARDRLAVVQARLRELQARAGADAVRAGRAPSLSVRDDIGAIDALVRTVTEHCERLEQVIRERRIANALSQLSTSLSGFTVDLSVTVRARTTTTSTATTGAASTDRRAGLLVTLDDLARRSAELPDAERAAFARRLQAVRDGVDGPDPARAAQAVGSLRGAVAEALHREAERVSFDRRRQMVASEFADVSASDLDAWDAWLQAPDDVALAGVRARLEAARERQRRAADQQFAVTQAAEVLRSLGYRVDVTDGDGVDALVARKDAWQHHGLRLLFPEATAAFSSTPESYGDTDPRDDVAFEEASCRDVDALLATLATRGVRAELRVHHQPGAVNVRRATTSDTRHRRTDSAPKERSL